MSNKSYSIVIGAVNGRFTDVFKTIGPHHAKQGFAFAIIAGNLFADPATASEANSEELSRLLKGEIEVPLPTYFSLGNQTLPAAAIEKLEANDGELCPNLSVLGRKVSFKTTDGFKIVAVGGKHSTSTDEPMSAYEASFTDQDAQAAGKDLEQIDILVTSEWPASISNGSKTVYAGKAPLGEQSISDACARLKPRYHFSASDAFFERAPFFQPGPSPRHVTRFVSLAPFGNTNTTGKKAIYAFSLEPSAPPPAKVPDGCTESPFAQVKKRKLDSQQDSYNDFRFSNGNGASYPDHGRRGGRKRQRDSYAPPTPGECFFCLSNRNCETHMIGAIGEDAYITVAKGPLSTKTTFQGIDFPGHMLIIPVQHSPTTSSISDTETRENTTKELSRWRTALHDMLFSRSKVSEDRAKLGAVTWEISRAGGVHLHWQFLPVPTSYIHDGRAEAAFDVHAENLSYPKFVKGANEIAEAEQGDYFKVMIWSDTWSKEMVLPLDRSFRFDLQFGRKTLAMLMGMESRTDWRACQQTMEEETADRDAFKEAFKEFDFTLANE